MKINKYSPAFKTLALILAMVSLFTLAVSGTGVCALLSESLYERHIEDAYQEQIQNRVQWFAGEAAWHYASIELGGVPEYAVDQYHGTSLDSIFRQGQYGYTVTDEGGHILATMDAPEESTPRRIILPGVNYLCLVPGSQRIAGQEPVISPAEMTMPPMEEPEATTEPLEHSEGLYLEAIPATVLEFTNIRNSPSLAGSIIGIAEKGMQLQLQQQLMADGSLWGFVKYGDGGGWLLMDTVVLGDPVTAAVAQTQKEAEREPEVSGVAIEDIPFYSVPHVNGDELGVLSAGTLLKILRVERVNNESWGLTTQGWVQMSQVETGEPKVPAETEETVEVTEAAEAEETAEETQAEETTEATEQTVPATEPETIPFPALAEAQETVNIYSEPDYYSGVVDELPLGDTIVVLSQETRGNVLWGLTEEGWLLMRGVKVLESVAPETESTEPETEATEPETTPTETVAETFPAETVPSGPDTFWFGYHDPHRGDYVELELYDLTDLPGAELPGITVDLYLTRDPLPNNGFWMLLRTAYHIRNQLLTAAAVSLAILIFAIVYLCHAAGRSSQSDVLRAGGFNRIPLDLYGLSGGFAVIGFSALAYTGIRHTMDYEQILGEVFFFGSIAAVSVILIALFFAFVAQIKTPGGYWYRNTLTVRCFTLIFHIYQWLEGKYGDKIAPRARKLLTGCWHLIVRLWRLTVTVVTFLTAKLEMLFKKLGSAASAFFRLLPMTWQWLLAGGVMLAWVFIATASRYDLGMVLSLLFGMFLILYGAHCFGILFDSVKKMRQGDLDSKVEDKLIGGAFKEFAEELNGLADVAMVAAQKQLKSERMKTELITNVSHDIKTPLTSIINYVDLLQKPHTEEEEQQYLEVLDRQSQRLKKLVDDLMEMSKASTGNLPVDMGIVNATEAVNQALGEFADKLEGADLVTVFRKPEYPVYMTADGRLVWRVLSNLLNNAVKYALPGTRVYIDLLEADGSVILSVKNVSREELNISADELLERFVRGDASRNTEGSGLGLNIAKSLVELQKGQLQLLVDGDLFKVTLIFPGVKLEE